MSIEVIKFTPHRKGALLGFADVYVPKMQLEICGMSVAEKGGKRWVNMPSREYTDDKGEKKYAPIMKFRDKDLNTRFCAICLEAIEKVMTEPVEENTNNGQMGLPF
tara:strand:- start:163 stop:480 length:318 start_codon:yes stop_codon:yes gene_type:complete